MDPRLVAIGISETRDGRRPTATTSAEWEQAGWGTAGGLAGLGANASITCCRSERLVRSLDAADRPAAVARIVEGILMPGTTKDHEP